MTILEEVSGADRRLDVSGYSSVLVEQEAYSPVWPTLALSLYKPGFLEVAISLRSNMRYLTTAEQDIIDRALRRSVVVVRPSRKR